MQLTLVSLVHVVPVLQYRTANLAILASLVHLLLVSLVHVVLALQFRIVSPVILVRTGQWILVLQGLVSLTILKKH